ncbi:hypothetical protein CEUSTIGMA_g6789.t1 [Chlamydomonas eustigma]|uniref:Uncharacterized protein n=1 Tax=Chlamydomonas eustigma TaxID=1157962 RepID=A0A250X8F9_9CHLO|nr:hypothetical protein CEUSTIGMA_g6789.t1 [Chlamydomonas eustigma]|eukprot:GAX79347.1 hypothetical protein CEUSTIGMA_g6789.t1 [Chlamydomonas eustigma]
MDKQMKKENKEFVAAMKLAEDDDRKVQLFRRESRTPPEAGDHDGLIEYFMNTVTEDMQFEVSRWRPTLNDSFFRHLDGVIGRLRFTGDASDEESSEQLVELETLRDYLVASCAAIDQAVVKMSSAKDRVAKLLSSKDKKEMILEMVAANEIDQSLMDLLQQNIQVARMAGQEDPARFMEKVLQACAKYCVAPLVAEASSLPALPGGMPMKELRLGAGSSNGAGGASSSGSSIIIPGGTIKSDVSGGGNTSTGGSKSSGLIIPGR